MLTEQVGQRHVGSVLGNEVVLARDLTTQVGRSRRSAATRSWLPAQLDLFDEQLLSSTPVRVGFVGMADRVLGGEVGGRNQIGCSDVMCHVYHRASRVFEGLPCAWCLTGCLPDSNVAAVASPDAFSSPHRPAAAIGLLAGCGDSTSSSNTPTTVPAATTTVAGALPKPQVKIPAKTPTELVITDITEGTGPAAADGDTLVVHYVGVRSADGTEFDNNYDSGTSLSVTLGVGQVIKGWDQGLIGIKAGGRRQLDIPTDLAYGDNPQGDVIQKGDALSFVIDVVTIIPKADPAEGPGDLRPTHRPTRPRRRSPISSSATVPGSSRARPSSCSCWPSAPPMASRSIRRGSRGTPLTFIPGSGQLPPGLEKAVEGMKVGGRRQVTIPFADAFGPDGNSQLGLPPSTDLIMVLDLVAVY